MITNAKSKNIVYLADANSCSDLHGDWKQDRPGEMWNVVLLSNGNYTIKNFGHSSFATCEFIAKPDVGNNIVGGSHQQQWKIVEERGNYVICPTKNGHVYWHLTDGESGTPITLEKYSQTKKIQWQFSKIEDSDEDDDEDDDEGNDDKDDDEGDDDEDDESEGSQAAASPAPSPPPTPPPASDVGSYAVALYDYEASEDNEISFNARDIITDIEPASEDWWQGMNSHGNVGLFPANYVMMLAQE